MVNVGNMYLNIPYMDGMGLDVCFFCWSMGGGEPRLFQVIMANPVVQAKQKMIQFPLRSRDEDQEIIMPRTPVEELSL